MLSRLGASIVVSVSVALLVTGCSSGGDADPAPGTDASTAPGTSETSGSPESTEPATPEVVPAAGEQITVTGVEGDLYRFRTPEGWTVSTSGFSASTSSAQGSSDLAGQSAPAFDGDDVDRITDSLLAARRGDRPRPVRQDDRVVDGVEAAVIEASSRTALEYVVAGRYSESVFTLTFSFPRDTPGSRETIDSVLASVEWL